MKKKLMAMILAAAAAFSFSTCSFAEDATEGAASAGRTLEEIQADGKIIMATNAEFEPFEYKDGDTIVGIDADIAQAIADKLGVDLEITDIAFASTIPAMQAGKADFIAAGMTVTEDRLKNVDFTDPYFNAGQAILVAADSDIKSRIDLEGKTVGVQTGTTGDQYVTDEDGTADVKVGEVKRYEKGMDAAADLIAGRIDAVVIDNFPAEKLAEKNPDKIVKLDENLTEEQYAIALPKNSELTAKFNEILQGMKDDGSLQAIEDKYLGDAAGETEAETEAE